MRKKIAISATLCVIALSALAFLGTSSDNIDASSSSVNLKKYQLAVCTIDDSIENNPLYYHFPTGKTNIKCESGSNILIGTLDIFYQEGWVIKHIVNVDARLQTLQNTVPYSLLYLEKPL